MEKERRKTYIAIDLKSFYASVECVERGYDPLRTNLVVADRSRTSKTICLAVSPALKSYGVPGRPRLFEAEQAVERINAERRKAAPGHRFSGKSHFSDELAADPSLELDFITAVPRMSLYMDYSARIFSIYQEYVAAEDIHIYSIDEVFMDVTPYRDLYGDAPRELAVTIIREVLKRTGITATAGIGSNLYLAKIAMDIVAKKMPADKDGVRIAELDEESYRRQLWTHRPLTDFWRIGRGTARRLEAHGMYTMGDVARCSLGRETDYYNEDLLYRLFGVNAELLIDHAWGWESVEIADIKAYRPDNNSLSEGQVLHEAYRFGMARNVMREMADSLSMALMEKGLVTDQVVLNVGYDGVNLEDPEIRRKYRGAITVDHYGRGVPKHAHGSMQLGRFTSSSRVLIDAFTSLFDEAVDENLLIRRINVTAAHVVTERAAGGTADFEQMNLFELDPEAMRRKETENARLAEDRRMQQAVLRIKQRFGKNAILKGMNFEEGATGRDRNRQIGGHRA